MENFVLEQIFLEAFNISLTAGWVIAVVLLLRALLKPVPKKYVCLLWFVVLFRLLCPVTLESEFSLVPQHEEVKYEIVYTTPQVETNSEPVNNVLNQTVNPALEQASAPNPMGSVNPLQVYIFIAAWIWWNWKFKKNRVMKIFAWTIVPMLLRLHGIMNLMVCLCRFRL